MTGPKTHIRTHTNKELNLFNLTLDDICIEDIAHSLACTNRFNGHTEKPINVAQHSVYCARLCASTPFALQALLHDGAEAYVGDVTKWLKHTPEMTAFREVEDSIQKLIYQKFNCPLEMTPEVEEADRIMVRYEGQKGFGANFRINHPNYPPLTSEEIKRVGKWAPWNWQNSEELFLVHYRMYNK